MISGDLDMLLLAIQTLTEFTLRYTNCNADDKILIRTNFDSLLDDEKTYLVSFHFIMNVNPAYDSNRVK